MTLAPPVTITRGVVPELIGPGIGEIVFPLILIGAGLMLLWPWRQLTEKEICYDNCWQGYKQEMDRIEKECNPYNPGERNMKEQEAEKLLDECIEVCDEIEVGIAQSFLLLQNRLPQIIGLCLHEFAIRPTSTR